MVKAPGSVGDFGLTEPDRIRLMVPPGVTLATDPPGDSREWRAGEEVEDDLEGELREL